MQNRPPLLVPLNINHPHCLDGLDHWRQLDLLDDDQIKRLCRQGLTCPLPAWEPQSAPASQQPLRAASIPYRPPVTASPSTPDPPPRQRSIAQAIKDEFSIRWLLGLGVFVVLISSAVLAASQWGQLPPAGQYGILWLYTLAFALTSFILERRQRLTLTAQTLHTIVLGLIPLNFWAMDELGLWESPLGWLTLALSSLSLTVWLWQESHLSRSQTVLFLLFSLCHWPLSRLPELSQLGLYLATLVGLLRYRQRPQLSLLAVVAYGLGSICVRGLLTDPLVLSNLGLTWGLLGWQVAQTTPPRRGRLGALFFICGWLLSLLNLSWQTLTVTGLALHRLAQRLQRLGQPPELLLTALVGLQGYLVLLQLLPDSLLEALWQNLETLFAAPSWQTFVAVLSLPYLLGLLWLTGWLRHQPSRRYLSQQGDAGIFLLGLGLTLMVTETLSEIWLLWLPLGAVLAVMIQRRYPQGLILANIAQLLLLGGVASLLDWQLEGNLSLEQWGLLLLGFALLETLWTQGQAAGVWQTSAWQITQFLGLSSYFILVAWRPSPLPFEESFPLAWLWWLLPFAWGIAARYGVAQYRRSAAWFAIVGANRPATPPPTRPSHSLKPRICDPPGTATGPHSQFQPRTAPTSPPSLLPTRPASRGDRRRLWGVLERCCCGSNLPPVRTTGVPSPLPDSPRLMDRRTLGTLPGNRLLAGLSFRPSSLGLANLPHPHGQPHPTFSVVLSQPHRLPPLPSWC